MHLTSILLVADTDQRCSWSRSIFNGEQAYDGQDASTYEVKEGVKWLQGGFLGVDTVAISQSDGSDLTLQIVNIGLGL